MGEGYARRHGGEAENWRDLSLAGMMVDEVALVPLIRSSSGPIHQGRRAPAGLAARSPAHDILGAEIPWFGWSSECGALLQGIDVNRAPGAIPVNENHRHIDAAPATNHRLSGVKSKRIKLQMLGFMRDEGHAGVRVGKGARIVFSAKSALASA
jgi:hypothetical protein